MSDRKSSNQQSHPVSGAGGAGAGPEAADRLFQTVYSELRGLAQAQRRRWQGDHTLNTTALVHEAYLRLGDGREPGWVDRSHFLSQAARAMRHILIDHARRRQAAKRGGGRKRLSLDQIEAGLSGGDAAQATDEALLALDDALERLTRLNERQGRIVECRFFGGLTIPETAEALEVSPATVKRGWAAAQAWLYRDLAESLGRGAD